MVRQIMEDVMTLVSVLVVIGVVFWVQWVWKSRSRDRPAQIMSESWMKDFVGRTGKSGRF